MNYLTQKLSSHMGDIKIIISLLLAYAYKKDNGGTKLCLRVHNQEITIHRKCSFQAFQFIRQTEIVMKKAYLKRLVWWWFGVLLLLRRAVPMVTVLKPVLYPRRAGTI